MTIREKVKSTLKDHIGKTLSRSEIIDLVIKKYPDTKRNGVLPSDYCYNRYNEGILFVDHILEYCGWDDYKVLGENYCYNGDIFWRKKGEDKDTIVGKWVNGEKHLYC